MLVKLRQKAFLKEPRLTEIWTGSMVLMMVHLLLCYSGCTSAFNCNLNAGGPGGVGMVLSCRNWHNEESYVSLSVYSLVHACISFRNDYSGVQ